MRRAFLMTGMMVLVCGLALAQEPASQPTSQPTSLDPTDKAAVEAAKGKEVVAEGKIVKAAWSRSGKVMTASFTSGRGGLQVAIFAANKDDMDKAFGGDVAKALDGAQVRVTGEVKDYRGRAEIIVDKPDQLTIVQAATTQP